MSVTFRSATTQGQDQSANQTVTRPTGTASGDLLLAIVTLSHDDSATTVTSTGWTVRLALTAATASGPRWAVLTKTATGSEPASYTFTKNGGTTSQFIVHAMALQGVDTSNPFVAGPTRQAGSANTATITAPSLTAIADSFLICAFGAEEYNATANSYSFSQPTGMTERTDAGHVFNYMSTNTQQINAAGATGTRAATFQTRSSGATYSSADGTGAISMILRSAVTSVPPTVDVGTDAAINQFQTVTKTATEDDGGATISSRAWTVQSGPAYVGNTLSTTASLSWRVETPGIYVVRYTATNASGSGFDEFTVEVDTVYHARYVNVKLAASPSAPLSGKTGATSPTPLKLSATRTNTSKSATSTRTANIKLSATRVGQKINVGFARLKLKAILTAYGRPGAGAATARIRLVGSRTGASSRSGTRTALTRLSATRSASKQGLGARSAALRLAMARQAAKDIPTTRSINVRLGATRTAFTRNNTVNRTALIKLSTNHTNRSTVRGAAQLARVRLRTQTVTSSVRFLQNYTAPFILVATRFGFRVETELAGTGLVAKADLNTKYELVCVARIPQASGPPVFLEIDPIGWTGLNITEELNVPTTLSINTKFTNITPDVLNRLRNLDELPTELWLNRNGKRMFSGPLLGVNATDENLTLEAKDVLAYTSMWIVENDKAFKTEQFEIVKWLIDQWQGTPYGHFGIYTDNIPPSGISRSMNYLKKELKYVNKAIDDLGKMAQGFDFSVDPVSRRLELYYPFRGQDRSTGEDAIVFDYRNVSSNTVTFSVGPADLASDSFATATQTEDAVLMGMWTNEELKTRYGRTAFGSTYDGAKDQETVDFYAEASGRARSQTLYIPGPNTRVTPDADINNYEVGDWVSYTMHNKLNALGAFRIRKRVINVGENGKENASVEFV